MLQARQVGGDLFLLAGDDQQPVIGHETPQLAQRIIQVRPVEMGLESAYQVEGLSRIARVLDVLHVEEDAVCSVLSGLCDGFF